MLTGISLHARRSRACFASLLWLATVVFLPILHVAFHDRPHDHAGGMVKLIEVVADEHDTATELHPHEASLDDSDARVEHGHPGHSDAVYTHSHEHFVAPEHCGPAIEVHEAPEPAAHDHVAIHDHVAAHDDDAAQDQSAPRRGRDRRDHESGSLAHFAAALGDGVPSAAWPVTPPTRRSETVAIARSSAPRQNVVLDVDFRGPPRLTA